MLNETNTTYTFFVGGGFSIGAYLIGGFDNLILSLVIMMAVDFILGIMIGAKEGYEQSKRVAETGIKEPVDMGISSNRAFLGLMKKTAMLLAVVVAVRLDMLMGNEGDFTRNAAIMAFIGMEGISFVENMNKLGVSLPSVITSTFAQMTQMGKEEPPKPPKEGEDK
jgi:toxin secretion/phage lysis holin